MCGIDDSSRFAVPAKLVGRLTAGPVCEALLATLPGTESRSRSSLTMGSPHRQVRFRRRCCSMNCAENEIRHLLTAPRSPTTTGKVGAVAQDDTC